MLQAKSFIYSKSSTNELQILSNSVGNEQQRKLQKKTIREYINQYRKSKIILQNKSGHKLLE